VLSARGAKALFPDGSAVGQQVKSDDLWRTVIGVVGDVECSGFARPMKSPQVYTAYTAEYGFRRSLSGQVTGEPLVVVIDSADAGRALPEALRAAAKAIGPTVMVNRVRQGHEWWSENVVTPRQRTVLLGILGGLGLLLALVGVFGVTTFAVSKRTAEIGVRMAFGAQPTQVVRVMLTDAAKPIVIGIMFGLTGAFFLTRVIGTFLYKTESRDPWAFAAAALVLAVCGLLAAWLAARKAAKVDPVVALRGD